MFQWKILLVLKLLDIPVCHFPQPEGQESEATVVTATQPWPQGVDSQPLAAVFCCCWAMTDS